MDRRSFLALIASAPIAALAPWPHFLSAERSGQAILNLKMRADSCELVFAQLMKEVEKTTRRHADVLSGVGYVRIGTDDNRDLLLERLQTLAWPVTGAGPVSRH